MGKFATPSRRRFVAGAALAASLPAPAILAQSTAPIRIGIVNTFSGVLGYSGDDNLKGMEFYLDQIGRTIAGRKIELIKEDDQANPQIGLQKVKKLVESDKVDLLMGPQVSAVAFALLNYIKESKTFLIVHGAGADAITWQRIPYLFRTTITSWQIAHPMGQWVHDTQGDEIVLLATDFAAGHDVLRVFKTAYEAGGGKVMKELYPPLGTNDFGPYLAEIRALNPPVVYCWFGGTDAVRFVQQYREFGIKAKLVGIRLADRQHDARRARPRRAWRLQLDHLHRHARKSDQPAFRRGISRALQELPEPLRGIWLHRGAGARCVDCRGRR